MWSQTVNMSVTLPSSYFMTVAGFNRFSINRRARTGGDGQCGLLGFCSQLLLRYVSSTMCGATQYDVGLRVQSRVYTCIGSISALVSNSTRCRQACVDTVQYNLFESVVESVVFFKGRTGRERCASLCSVPSISASRLPSLSSCFIVLPPPTPTPPPTPLPLFHTLQPIYTPICPSVHHAVPPPIVASAATAAVAAASSLESFVSSCPVHSSVTSLYTRSDGRQICNVPPPCLIIITDTKHTHTPHTPHTPHRDRNRTRRCGGGAPK